MNFRGFDSFAKQVLVGISRRSKEQSRKLVSDEPVDLFRHTAIPGSQSSLNVPDGHKKLGANQGGSHGGVYIAVNQDQVRFALQNDRLQPRDDFGRLLSVAAGTDAKIHIGCRHFELLEEDARHVWIVMLAGMDQRLANSG